MRYSMPKNFFCSSHKIGKRLLALFHSDLVQLPSEDTDDAVAETARLTESRPELDEQEQQAINERLAYIVNHIHEQPEVRIKYFVPDEQKSGGAIIEVSGKVKKISATDGILMFADGNSLLIRDIICISTK